MGKRELVLMLAFIVAGAIVYQVSAPPLAQGQEGFSFGRLAQHVRQAVHGRPIHASVQTTRTDAVDASTTEVRVNVPLVDLTVVGEDRTDVVSALTVDSDGIDDREAQQLARATTLQVDRAGAGLVFRIDFPREGRQRGSLALRVPKRLLVRVESDNRNGNVDVQHVAAVDVKGNRGTAHVSDIDGEITLMHRGGAPVTIARAGSVRLTVTSGDVHVSDIRGNASIETTGSNVELASVRGPLDVKSRNAEVRLHDIAQLQGMLRCDMQSGRLDIDGLQTETRVDARDTEIRISLARAVPVTVYDSADDITIVAPSDGYTLDAVATDGELSIDEREGTGVSVAKAADAREQRAAGPVRGGGPVITLRNSHGDISIRARTGK
jgi:Tfp pilus assembly protein FimT